MNRGSRTSNSASSDRQMTLFPGGGASVGSTEPIELPAGVLKKAGQGRRTVADRTIVLNPHLLAARRIARRMRRLKDREAETQAGLAICAQLKAYLQDDLSSSPDSRH